MADIKGQKSKVLAETFNSTSQTWEKWMEGSTTGDSSVLQQSSNCCTLSTEAWQLVLTTRCTDLSALNGLPKRRNLEAGCKDVASEHLGTAEGPGVNTDYLVTLPGVSFCHAK